MSYNFANLKSSLNDLRNSLVDCKYIVNDLDLESLNKKGESAWKIENDYSLRLKTEKMDVLLSENDYFFLSLNEDKKDTMLTSKEHHIKSLSTFLKFISNMKSHKDFLNFDNYPLLDIEKERYQKAFDKYKKIFNHSLFDFENFDPYIQISLSDSNIGFTLTSFMQEEKISFDFTTRAPNNKISLSRFSINNVGIGISSKKTYLGMRLPNSIDYCLTTSFLHNDTRTLGFNSQNEGISMLKDSFYGFKSHHQKIDLTFINNGKNQKVVVDNPELKYDKEMFELINLVKPVDYLKLFNNDYQLTNTQKEALELEYLVSDKLHNKLPLDDLFGNYREKLNSTQEYYTKKTTDILDLLKTNYLKTLGIQNNAQIRKNRF